LFGIGIGIEIQFLNLDLIWGMEVFGCLSFSKIGYYLFLGFVRYSGGHGREEGVLSLVVSSEREKKINHSERE
jgi:hypothetical protein